MFRTRVSQFGMAALGVTFAVSVAVAQQYEGRAPTSVEQIRGQDIGSGYSVGSLNQIALRNAQGFLSNPGRTAARSGAPSSLGLSSGASSKPFSTYSPAPTVSPYLNLFREDFDGNSDLNYNTLVRPVLQQQQFNEQMQRQSIEIAKRLQSLAAQADFNPQGSESQYPTGHKTVFNYLGHYYPAPARQRR